MLGICGLYQELTGDIQKLLDHVPILDQYKKVIKSDHDSIAMFKVCRTCYQETVISSWTKSVYRVLSKPTHVSCTSTSG